LGIRFDRGYSQALPYPDGSFDRVLSALMLHHLEGDVRTRTAQEALRVLGDAAERDLRIIEGVS